MRPEGIWASSLQLMIADVGENRTLQYTISRGAAIAVFGQANLSTTSPIQSPFVQFNASSVFVNGSFVFVADSGNNRILAYAVSSPGAPTEVWGQGGNFDSYTKNLGGVSAASLNFPTGVSVDSTGMYVADRENNRVLFYPPLAAHVATVATTTTTPPTTTPVPFVNICQSLPNCTCFGNGTCVADVTVIDGVVIPAGGLLIVTGNTTLASASVAVTVGTGAAIIVNGTVRLTNGTLVVTTSSYATQTVAVISAGAIDGEFASVVVVYEGDGKSCTKATGTPEYGADTVAVTMTFDRQCGGLSGGAIAGIVVGSVVVAAAVIVAVVVIMRRKKNHSTELASMRIKLDSV